MTEERELLRDTVAALVVKHASPAAVREAMESERGYDESLWRLLCEQVGAAALVVPEEYGGAGGTLGDAAVVLEELGKGLVPSPLLGTTLAELALLAADQPDADALGSLAEGAAIGAVVFDPGYVINGDVADIVVAADDGKLTRWTAFNAEPVAAMDPDPPAGPRHTARARRRSAPTPVSADAAAILLAAEQIGAAARCLELTVDYTKERQQFGRPIGSFQALKHRMADLYVAVQAARAVVNDAADAPVGRPRRRWPALRPPRRSTRWPPKASNCTAASRSPGNTTCSCISNARTAVRSCSGRRANICRRLESEVF